MLKVILVRNLIKLAGCTVLAVGLGANAAASCGDSLASMAGGKAVVSSSIANQLAAEASTNPATYSSIVGMWYVQFVVGGQTIQEAYQNWNTGGTEVHNPNVDPRTSNICLGTWIPIQGGYKLAHRVWSYDTTGDFQGTIHLGETVHLNPKGTVLSGTFRLDFYDPSGNFEMQVAGTVVGQRIQVQ
jgi:hypothetical protein